MWSVSKILSSRATKHKISLPARIFVWARDIAASHASTSIIEDLLRKKWSGQNTNPRKNNALTVVKVFASFVTFCTMAEYPVSRGAAPGVARRMRGRIVCVSASDANIQYHTEQQRRNPCMRQASIPHIPYIHNAEMLVDGNSPPRRCWRRKERRSVLGSVPPLMKPTSFETKDPRPNSATFSPHHPPQHGLHMTMGHYHIPYWGAAIGPPPHLRRCQLFPPSVLTWTPSPNIDKNNEEPRILLLHTRPTYHWNREVWSMYQSECNKQCLESAPRERRGGRGRSAQRKEVLPWIEIHPTAQRQRHSHKQCQIPHLRAATFRWSCMRHKQTSWRSQILRHNHTNKHTRVSMSCTDQNPLHSPRKCSLKHSATLRAFPQKLPRWWECFLRQWFLGSPTVQQQCHPRPNRH